MIIMRLLKDMAVRMVICLKGRTVQPTAGREVARDIRMLSLRGLPNNGCADGRVGHSVLNSPLLGNGKTEWEPRLRPSKRE